MAINPNIRDQAYQFFIEEAPELLQILEAGLLTLRQEKNTAKVHALMRAAHSLKGGAASVELEAIKTLAHRLENIFKALYSDTVEIDTNLESQLLQAYDCLRLPLMEQIQTGYFDPEHALVLAEPLFVQIEDKLGDALNQADTYIPSSSELGIDMAQSIFEVDVGEGLERLAEVVANPQNYEVGGELRAQAEVFAGFAELLNQPGFGAIAHTAQLALDAYPERALTITQLALADFEFARQAILAAHAQSTNVKPISPSSALLALAHSDGTASQEQTKETVPALEDVLSIKLDENLSITPVPEDIYNLEADGTLEDIFATAAPSLNPSVAETNRLDEVHHLEPDLALEAIFANAPELFEQPSPTTEVPTHELDFCEIVDIESVTDEAVGDLPVVETGVDSAVVTSSSDAENELPITPFNIPSLALENGEAAAQSIAQIFEQLPPVEEMPVLISRSNAASTTAENPPAINLVPTSSIPGELLPTNAAHSPTPSPHPEVDRGSTDIPQGKASPVPTLSVRVDSERLERMNNVVGELAINRNGLSLQNQQLQRSVRELLDRFVQVQGVVGHLRKLSDQMLATPERPQYEAILPAVNPLGDLVIRQADFDSLELDRYGVLNSRLQELIEDMVQLEEAVDDVSLFAKQSNRTLEQQRQMLTQLRDELMWARMLPLSEVLNRFPRVLRDLSTNYHKSVTLNLSGTGVLVDKAALEKLYDPLLHLLRNAFDHGIESPEIRRQQGKPEQGKIEIRAYHQGSQTIIEVKDDGQGLDTESIGKRAIELGLLSAEQLATTSNNHLFELVFEPGFSTAKQVSELSGRGVGLDVVRSQMRSLKGSITVSSSPGVGTTFTLHLPLTLTIAKLLVCLIGPTAIALPSDSVEEIVVPKSDQVKTTGEQRFLRWRDQIVPAYRLADILDYTCPLPESAPSQALVSVPSPADWALPMLVLRQEEQVLALEIDRLVTEQELVIKPFGSAIAPPSFTYGCTILGDGSLIPVIDGTVLLDQLLGHNTTATRINTGSKPITLTVNENSSINQTKTGITAPHAPTVLVVDDAVALRRTLALTLERAGCRVLQARDGREALEQLRQGSSRVNLVVCDIEMPNMNGFEFLGQRRQDPQLSKIPVVMLTSRSNDKHRWLAMRLGATAYFTKPYLEQEFLVAIKHIIDEQKSQSTLESSRNSLQLQEA
ncbi:hybrid sensor histidine kinase/response regulator [Allocoleopsis franciscana]|uniref:histidine kinase n=1 Tax=Allocoleopsis franciscana PCC 7113 TaxID=1173027 RepID=K9WA99_9CYAN|nr:hybrid sensor histidine kinase/response regulator [Allocoleopsis franciscana]AFZ17148.1 chemotaxis protein histidine kinase-like protein [Allocoleopsis franciscana PCC 7113]